MMMMKKKKNILLLLMSIFNWLIIFELFLKFNYKNIIDVVVDDADDDDVDDGGCF